MKAFTHSVAFFLAISIFTGLNAQVNKTINVATAGTLVSLLTANEKETVNNLTVTGNINAFDFYSMRDSFPSLQVIDLDAVSAVGDSIPFRAFAGNRLITLVILPSSITRIGMRAFTDCNGIQSITIPPSVTSIGDWALGWTGITSITIPTSVTSIGEWAFAALGGLTSITIPSSVTSIGDFAFIFSGLTSVTIPASVTSMGKGVFMISRNFSNIVVDESNLFYSSLDGVLFNKNKTEIIEYPQMKNGSSYTIPSSVTSICDNAFYDCTGLTSVAIPSSVTYIGDMAFYGCTGLTSVTIPSSVTYIGAKAFYGCAGLTSVSIPASVTSMGMSVFSSCSNLSSIVVDESNLFYSSIDGVVFNKNKTEIVAYPPMKNGSSYTIPSSVTSIGDFAFYGCKELTSVTIPSSVTSIGDHAFDDLSGLTSITIPSSVTAIGDFAFFNCKNLQNIKVLSPVDLSSSIQVFGGVNLENCILFVPKHSINEYDTINQWSGFSNIVEMELSLSQSALDMAAEAGSIATFEIFSTMDWKVNSNSPWLVPSPASGFENDTITLTAEANSTSSVRNAIVTISADGLPDKTITVQQFAGTTTGTDHNQISPVKVFPMPVHDLLYIAGSSKGRAMIFDLEGKLMISKYLNIENESIDMSLLPDGIYILKIDGQNGTWTVPKQ